MPPLKLSLKHLMTTPHRKDNYLSVKKLYSWLPHRVESILWKNVTFLLLKNKHKCYSFCHREIKYMVHHYRKGFTLLLNGLYLPCNSIFKDINCKHPVLTNNWLNVIYSYEKYSFVLKLTHHHFLDWVIGYLCVCTMGKLLSIKRD